MNANASEVEVAVIGKRTDRVDSSAGLLGGCGRLWSGPLGPGGQTRLFRRTFTLERADAEATFRIFCESRYHVWINGVYLGRGPCFHHPTELLVDRYSLKGANCMRLGENVIAVLVHAPDVSMHNHVRTDEPGLVADLEMGGENGHDQHIQTDERWKVTHRTGWHADSPRRNWAIDYVEQFEMAAAPGGWREIGFDDAEWDVPDVHRPATTIAGGRFLERPLPDLRYEEIRPAAFLGHYRFALDGRSGSSFTSSGELGKSIMNAAWEPLAESLNINDAGFTISGLVGSKADVLCFDLGREYVGQVLLDCECAGAGIIDIGWSETIESGRPQLVRKGVGYVDRIYAVAGRLQWEPIQFSAARYLVICLRGFEGSVRINRLCLRASEADVEWLGRFQSDDRRLTEIFDICVWSQRIGTQEGQMDCPSREQSPYIADGMLTARWFARLSGDVRHWRYLVHEQFRRQSPNGLLRAAVFSGRNDTALDYTPLATIGVRDFYRFTGDRDTVVELLEPCRRTLNFFDSHRLNNGLCTWTWQRSDVPPSWENVYDPTLPKLDSQEQLVLFIDHPGMGWHNKHEAGIDRRGTNAALNAILVLAKRALADLESVAGEHARARELRADASHLSALIGGTFFDARRGLFVDGILEGQQHSQISEQTNSLAIAAGCCDDDMARSILARLLQSKDTAIARNGPYFWAYLFPELSRLGLHELALDRTRALWGRMVEGGATALWETFLGDDLDTWCHPWAGAPLEFLLSGILGLPGLIGGGPSILRPRFDLLAKAEGSIFTSRGLFSIGWTRSVDGVHLHGVCPEGVTAEVRTQSDEILVVARGEWEFIKRFA